MKEKKNLIVLIFIFLFESCMLIEPSPPDSLVISYDYISDEVVLHWQPQALADRYLIYRGLSPNTNDMKLIASTTSNEYRDTYPISGNLFYSFRVQNFFSAGKISPPVMIYAPTARSIHFPFFLTNNIMTNACIASSGTLWYKFTVSNNQDYQIDWKDQAYFDNYVDILVSLYNDINTYPLSGMDNVDYSPIIYHSDKTGFVFLKVQTISAVDYGNFEIGYHRLTN